jgi:type IV secretory pathway protease TraF
VYHVPADTVRLLSGHDPRSFDSRYFGAVPVASIQGIAHPIWVVEWSPLHYWRARPTSRR